MTNTKTMSAGASLAPIQSEGLAFKRDALNIDTSALELAASWVGNRRKEATGYPFFPQTSGSPF